MPEKKPAMISIRKRYTPYMVVLGCATIVGYAWIYMSLEEQESQKSVKELDYELSELIRNMREHGYLNNPGIPSKTMHVSRHLNSSLITISNALKFQANKSVDISYDDNSEDVAQNETVDNNKASNLTQFRGHNAKTQNESINLSKQEEVNPIETDEHFDITDNDDHIHLVHKQSIKRLFKPPNFNENVHNTLSYRKLVYGKYYRPIRNQGDIDCNGLIVGNRAVLSKARTVMNKVPRKAIAVDKYIRTADCNNFKAGRGYIDHPLSETERTFPLAFGIMVYKDIEQVERLLRAIYRPHNYYCIHADMKTSDIDRRALGAIVNCFDNVYISEESVNVTWGEFSVLEAELKCMTSLWKYKKWKYYINLTGQEFPLKTNREIVSILKAMEGANIVDGTWVRARERYFYRWTAAGHPPPHGIRPIKGSLHVAINRNFVDFSLHDHRALDFLKWLKHTQIPDETFFASLNHNPFLGIKGSFLGEPEEYPLKPSFMRYKNWAIGHSTFTRGCAGKFVRHVCVLGVGDIMRAYADIGLIANKFHLDFEYLALDCLEEILHELTWKQYVDDSEIDTSFYASLDYIKYKLN